MNRIVQLKNGGQALVRPVVTGDAEGLLEVERAIVRDGRGVVQDLEDLASSVEEMAGGLQEWVSGKHSGWQGMLLVALISDRVVGSGLIHRFRPGRLRHVAQVEVGIHPDSQALGLGRALMDALLGWPETDNGSGVLRIELSVRADNDRAIRLYESLGFHTEGTRRRLVRNPDGSFADDHIMALALPPPPEPLQLVRDQR